MSEKIYGVLPQTFIIRMRNWALTNAGVDIGYVTSRMYALGVQDTYGQVRPPILIGEAEDTGRALSKLPARYQQAVSLFWQYEGRSLAWFAMRSGQGVDYRTYQARVIEGHERLRVELARQAEETRRYKESARRATLIG